MADGSIPVQIGPYRVIRVIGEGGMGRVYEVEHTLIGRRAAVKVLSHAFTGKADIVQRFLNEARAANRIEHPGVVQIYEFGSMPDGAPYFVMELLKGYSLSRVLKMCAAFAEQEARAVARLVARVLASVHAAGIVHRDLKPDNVFLLRGVERPDEWTVKILDFGIAKLQEQTDVGVVTTTDSWMGTPSYMSPEQIQGAKGVDARADVYSLGVILFRMLAGRVPFEADNYGALIVMVATSPPPRVCALAPWASAQVDRIVQRAMAKRPERRYQSMDDFAAALAEKGAEIDTAAGRSGSVKLPSLDQVLFARESVVGLPEAGEASTQAETSGARPSSSTTREATTLTSGATETRRLQGRRARWTAGAALGLVLGLSAAGVAVVAAVDFGPGDDAGDEDEVVPRAPSTTSAGPAEGAVPESIPAVATRPAAGADPARRAPGDDATTGAEAPTAGTAAPARARSVAKAGGAPVRKGSTEKGTTTAAPKSAPTAKPKDRKHDIEPVW